VRLVDPDPGGWGVGRRRAGFLARALARSHAWFSREDQDSCLPVVLGTDGPSRHARSHSTIFKFLRESMGMCCFGCLSGSRSGQPRVTRVPRLLRIDAMVGGVEHTSPAKVEPGAVAVGSLHFAPSL
jgi:hypothetical protein